MKLKTPGADAVRTETSPSCVVIPLRILSVSDNTPELERRAELVATLRQAARAARRGNRAELSMLLIEAATNLIWIDEATRACRSTLSASRYVDSSVIRAAEAADRLDDVIVYDRYFGVERATSLTPRDAVLGQLAIVIDLVNDLRQAPLVGDDVAALLSEALRMVASPGEPEISGDRVVPRRDAVVRAEGDPIGRWKLGHWVYASACRAGSASLLTASEHVRSGQLDAATSYVVDAAERLQGLTAGMVLAAAISSTEYVDAVRPTMAPPMVAVELTGSMNLDYAAFKHALAALREACGGVGRLWVDLARKDRQFAVAFDRLLGLDLVDLERHIELTHRLVGRRPALHEREAESAVASLRSMYVHRLRAYGPLLQHGRITHTALAYECSDPASWLT